MSNAILLNHKDLVQPFMYRYLNGTNSSGVEFFGNNKHDWAMWVRPLSSKGTINRASGFSGDLYIDKINVKKVQIVICGSGFGSSGQDWIEYSQYGTAKGGAGGAGGYYRMVTIPICKGYHIHIAVGNPGRWMAPARPDYRTPGETSITIYDDKGNNVVYTANIKGGPGGARGSSHGPGGPGTSGIILPNYKIRKSDKPLTISNGGGGQGGAHYNEYQWNAYSGGLGGGQDSEFPAPNGASPTNNSAGCSYSWTGVLGVPGTGNGAPGCGFAGCSEKDYNGTGAIGGFWMTVA